MLPTTLVLRCLWDKTFLWPTHVFLICCFCLFFEIACDSGFPLPVKLKRFCDQQHVLLTCCFCLFFRNCLRLWLPIACETLVFACKFNAICRFGAVILGTNVFGCDHKFARSAYFSTCWITSHMRLDIVLFPFLGNALSTPASQRLRPDQKVRILQTLVNLSASSGHSSPPRNRHLKQDTWAKTWNHRALCVQAEKSRSEYHQCFKTTQCFAEFLSKYLAKLEQNMSKILIHDQIPKKN